jgi:hypothetical protein
MPGRNEDQLAPVLEMVLSFSSECSWTRILMLS